MCKAASAIQTLLGLVEHRLAQASDDPFGNPIMVVALAITRQIDDGELDPALISAGGGMNMLPTVGVPWSLTLVKVKAARGGTGRAEFGCGAVVLDEGA